MQCWLLKDSCSGDRCIHLLLVLFRSTGPVHCHGPLCIRTSLPLLFSILPFCSLFSFLVETQITAWAALMLLGWRNAASSLSACILARPYPFQLPCNPLGLQLWCSVGETAFRFAGVFEEQCENVGCNRILATSTCCLCRQFNFFFVLLC